MVVLFSKIPHKTFLILLIIIGIGAFFRLYNSYNTLRFLSDEAGGMEAVRQIWRNMGDREFGKLPLLGPEAGTAGGRVYHGAFYFYLIAIPALITNFHPYGVALFVIVLNIAGIYLMFIVGKNLFDKPTGLIAALLFAISSFATMYGRWAWNPNLIVFFVLLTLMSFWKIKEGDKRYWPVFSLAVAATTQIYILMYIFLMVMIVPLLCFHRVGVPNRRLFFITLASFLLPLIPAIISQLNHVAFYRTTTGILFEELFRPQTIGVIMNFPSLLMFYLRELLGINGQAFPFVGIPLPQVTTLLFGLLLFGSVILGTKRILERKSSISQPTSPFMSFTASNSNLRTSVLALWTFAFILIILGFNIHYYGEPPSSSTHFLLFGLPLVLILFAFVVWHSVSHPLLLPTGVALMLLVLYANMMGSIAIVKTGSAVTYKDEQGLVEYLQNYTQSRRYEVEVSHSPEMGALISLFKWTSIPPERIIQQDSTLPLGDDIAEARYNISLPWVPNDTACPQKKKLKSFGALELYECLFEK